MRAALEWSLRGGNREVGVRLAAALWQFWFLSRYLTEGCIWLEKALSAGSEVSKAVRAKVLCGAGAIAAPQGDLGRALTLLEESLILRREVGDRSEIWESLFFLGKRALEAGDYESASDFYEEGLALAREMEDRYCIARVLKELGEIKFMQGDYRRAADLLEESLILYRTVGNRIGLPNALRTMGRMAHAQGEYGPAMDLFKESLVLSRELGNKLGAAISLRLMAHVVSNQGDFSRANALLKEALVLVWEMGAKRGIARSLEVLAIVALAQDRIEQAVRFFGAAEALRESIDVPLVPYDRSWHDRGVTAARFALGEERVATVWAEGRSMTMEQVIEYALTAVGKEKCQA